MTVCAEDLLLFYDWIDMLKQALTAALALANSAGSSGDGVALLQKATDAVAKNPNLAVTDLTPGFRQRLASTARGMLGDVVGGALSDLLLTDKEEEQERARDVIVSGLRTANPALAAALLNEGEGFLTPDDYVGGVSSHNVRQSFSVMQEFAARYWHICRPNGVMTPQELDSLIFLLITSDKTTWSLFREMRGDGQLSFEQVAATPEYKKL